MDVEFIRERITQLRISKGVSEYKMSYDLGHSRGYINNISSGKTLPSMTEFLAICEYLDITPADFFNANAKEPKMANDLITAIEQLDAEDIQLISSIIERIQK